MESLVSLKTTVCFGLGLIPCQLVQLEIPICLRLIVSSVEGFPWMWNSIQSKSVKNNNFPWIVTQFKPPPWLADNNFLRFWINYNSLHSSVTVFLELEAWRQTTQYPKNSCVESKPKSPQLVLLEIIFTDLEQVKATHLTWI